VVREIAIMVLMSIGASFGFLAAVGLLRMPDLVIRLHAMTKAATFGIGGVVLASIVWNPEADIWMRGVLLCAFTVVSVPTSSQMIVRAAFRTDVSLFRGMVVNDLERDRSADSSSADGADGS
jgi:multicomponent Na+:H+ antiporter subunit G